MSAKRIKELQARVEQLETIILNEMQNLQQMKMTAREQKRISDEDKISGIIRRLTAWVKSECLMADPVAEVNDHDVDLTKVQVVSKPAKGSTRYFLTLVNGVEIPVDDLLYSHEKIRQQWRMVKRFALWR